MPVFTTRQPLTLIASAILSLSITACGGGGGGSSSPAVSSPDTSNKAVSGPLDTLQEPLNTYIAEPLIDGISQAELQAATQCLADILINDIPDVPDALLAAGFDPQLDPATQFNAVAEDIVGALTSLQQKLQGLPGALTGDGCDGNNGSVGNPLNNTPLATLGQLIDSDIGAPGSADFDALAQTLQQWQQAFQQGLAAIPLADQNDLELPLMLPALNAITDQLGQLQQLMSALASADPNAASAAISNIATTSLESAQTVLIPLDFLESISQRQGAITDVLGQAQSGLSQALSLSLDDWQNPLDQSALSSQLNTALAEFQAVVGQPLTEAFGNLPTSLAPVSNTPLDALASPLAAVQQALQQDNDLTQTPLDQILSPLLSALQQSGQCPLANAGLVGLCTPLLEIEDALNQNNPIDLLSLLDQWLLGG